MDNVLEKIRDIFATGVKASPGYRLGEAFNMAVDTSRDIDSLPTTDEREDNQE